MKAIIVILATILLAGCFPKDIHVEMVNAELVKVDTLYRQTHLQKLVLTWKDNHNMEYKSFVPLEEGYPIGTRIPVLVTTRQKAFH